MDPLEFSYDTIDAIPETFRPLYAENGGKFVLSGVNGVKSVNDVNNLQEALRKERNDHKLAQDAIRPWNALGKKPDEILSQLDRIAELEAAAAGKIDEKQIEKMVESRLGQKIGPIERQLRESSTLLETVSKERDTFRDQLYRRDMSDAVRAVALEMKVVPTAVADVELFAQSALERQEDGTYITKAGIPGVTPGLDARGLLKDMQKHRPHWWPNSGGGGAGGGNNFGGESNPWTAANWSLTEQGNIVKTHGMAKAQEMAKAANSRVGATGPTKTK